MTLVGRRLRRLQYPRFGLLLGSVVRQFGHSADLAISPASRSSPWPPSTSWRMRQLDGSGQWIHRQISRLRARLERLLGGWVEALAAWLYPKIDLDGVEPPSPSPSFSPHPQPQPSLSLSLTLTLTLTLPAPTPSRSPQPLPEAWR